jgi:lipopolysaccharide export system permease protein
MIWQRHFFLQTLKAMFFTFVALALLYVFIDYASHTKLFHGSHSAGSAWLYYSFSLFIILPKLLPFCFLIASLAVLWGASSRHELLALYSAAASKRSILKPFIALGILCALLLYANDEFIRPKAVQYTSRIEEQHAKKRRQTKYIRGVELLPLSDGSAALFRDYDKKNGYLKYVLWIRSIDDIWGIEQFPLTGGDVDSKAQGVFHFTRNLSGVLTLDPKQVQVQAPAASWDDPNVWVALTDPQDLSLSNLFHRLPKEASGDKEVLIASAFFYKIVAPWIALLAFLVAAPYCFSIQRGAAVFSFFSLAIFGLVAFFLILDAFSQMAALHILTPFAAMAIPIGCLGAIATRNLIKLNA